MKREQQRRSPEAEMYLHEERPRRLGGEQVRVVGTRPEVARPWAFLERK